jgi:MSHA biogenesis protein MshO
MNRRRGFTLIELILVIVIGSVLAVTLTVFVVPAIESYLASRARAELADQADTALRRVLRDVRAAVPNSIRTPGSQCFELVPTSAGGRLRIGPDTVNDASPACTPAADCNAAAPACGAVLDVTRATSVVDLLSGPSTNPVVGDQLVVGNQNANDVYAGTNRARITGVCTPNAVFGRLRLAIASTQFPLGFSSGRFTTVPGGQAPVFYVCSGADGTLDADGNGKGKLVRLAGYGFNAAYPTACPAAGSGAVVATRIRSCTFAYDPNQGGTQQSGFLWMQLDLTRRGETVSLAAGAHVVNTP